MYFLIPALITSDESEALLRITMEHIPAVAEARVIVISQGRRPSLVRPDHIRELLGEHHDLPLTKWQAIVRARALLSDGCGQVVLLDADDPVDPASFLAAMPQMSSEPESCFIGCRREISLFAADALSADSRFFLEILSNTLLIQRFRTVVADVDDPPDIQSGFYVLPARRLNQLNFEYVADYGGELALCYQLWESGLTTQNLDYIAQARRASSYKLKQIYAQIMDLPFFRSVTAAEIERAKNLAPILYRRYFNERLATSYQSEIAKILAFPRTR